MQKSPAMISPPPDYPERYRMMPQVTARNSGRSFWFSACREFGRQFARAVWKGLFRG